jgi:hypothetical protein
MSIEWMAGLVDGEGCFTIDIYKSKVKNSILFIPIFYLGMKDGPWLEKVVEILDSNKIPYYIKKGRRKGNLVELKVRSWDNVKKVCSMLLPYSVIKKPLLGKFLEFHISTHNQHTDNTERVRNMVALLDFIRSFNIRKNRKYKWSSDKIKEFYKKE